MVPELKDPELTENAGLPQPSRQAVPRLPFRRRGPLKTWQYTAAAATLGLLLSAGVVAAAGPWDSGQRTAERARAASWEADGGADHGRSGRNRAQPVAPAPPAPDVLAALGAPQGSAPAPTKRALADVLDPLMKDPSLGTLRTASVVDALTGEELYAARSGEPVLPASTTKIATAVAALTALGPEHRILTRTVADPASDEVVLVGGGDPTLTAARLRALAKATAAALREHPRGDTIRVTYDTSLYSGPVRHPIGPNGNIAPVTALMLNEGRLDDSTSGPTPRAADPAALAAKKFAQYLKEEGVRLGGAPQPSKAGPQAEELGRVASAPLSALVERMLTNSDNDLAEALARQTALASGEPASFKGGEKAIRERLRELQLPVDGTRFADGSGLSRSDRITARLLTALLAKAADPARPELRSVVTGLPVAGFTGTLRNRYDSEGAAPGTGLVRAKTGTLTGVNTLAGSVVDADGRLLLFAFTASGTTSPQSAQSTLDRLAATVANCGCR